MQLSAWFTNLPAEHDEQDTLPGSDVRPVLHNAQGMVRLISAEKLFEAHCWHLVCAVLSL